MCSRAIGVARPAHTGYPTGFETSSARVWPCSLRPPARSSPWATTAPVPTTLVDERRLALLDRFSVLALVAAKQAIEQSGISFEGETGSRTACVVGVGVAGWEAIEDSYRRVFLEGGQGFLAWREMCAKNRKRLREQALDPTTLTTMAAEEMLAYQRAMEHDPLLPRQLWLPWYRGEQVYDEHRGFLRDIASHL